MVARCRWDPTEVVTDRQTVLNGNGTPLISLPTLMLTAVSAATVTRAPNVTETLTVGVGADVEWSENGLLELRRCVWPYGRGNVTVTWSGGYESTPADLAAVLSSISRRLANGTPAQQRKMLSASVTYAQSIAEGGLLTAEEMVLDRYRYVGTA